MLTKPLVINRLSTGLLADGSESGGIVNNLAFALWITGNRLGDFGFWGGKKNEYARWCFFGGLVAFSLLWVVPPHSALCCLLCWSLSRLVNGSLSSLCPIPSLGSLCL
jgi:hypothetical protein